jgi:chromosomal replication initiation ATPase DnaA
MENALSSEGVLRTGVESIIWEMVATHSYAGMTVFRQKYLGLENLLIDNLWVLEKKPATTAEICRLIRNRQKVGKLTVVASDISEQQWAARNCEVAQLLASGQSVRLGGPVSL